MWNLVHIIAVAFGWMLWQLTQKIIIAAVFAVVVEGIMLAIVAAIWSKAADKANTEPIPTESKRLWWRIALVVVFGFFALVGVFLLFGFPIAALVRGEQITYGWSSEAVEGMIRGAVFCIPIVFCIISLKKAIRHNKRLEAASGTAEADAKGG